MRACVSSRRAAGTSTTPPSLATVLRVLEGIQADFNGRGGATVSLADLIVLGGNVAVEQAAAAGGVTVEVPFRAGRVDATQEQTDVESFGYLEPKHDGFRNYVGKPGRVPAEYLLLDRANLLGLSAPQMTVLVGGLRVLGANTGGSTTGVLTDRVGTLTNDFFVNLLELGTTWTAANEGADTFTATNAAGEQTWTGSRVDLLFGSNSEPARPRRGLRQRRRRREVRPRLRRRVVAGHGGRPLRRQVTA